MAIAIALEKCICYVCECGFPTPAAGLAFTVEDILWSSWCCFDETTNGCTECPGSVIAVLNSCAMFSEL